MVHHLISALSSLTDTNIDIPDGNDESAAAEHSLLVRIGTSIKSPRVVSPIQNARRRHLFHDNTSSTASLSPERRSMPSRIFGSIASSLTTLLSPHFTPSERGCLYIVTRLPTIRSQCEMERIAIHSSVATVFLLGSPATNINSKRATLQEVSFRNYG